MGAPWFKLYANDLLSDSKIRLLTDDQLGKLVKLWAFACKDGSIPSDLAIASRLLGNCSSEDLAPLKSFFRVSDEDPSLMVSERMMREQGKYVEKCEKLRHNASIGGKKKAENAKAKALANAKANALAKPAESESESESDINNNPLPPPGDVAEVANPSPKEKKKPKPRGRDFSIQALAMSPDQQAEFDRLWNCYPKLGWDFRSRKEQPRRINYAEAAKRYKEILDYTDVRRADGSRITPTDLSDAMVAWVASRWAEAKRQGLPAPCIPCIGNLLSSVEGEKNHWKEALLTHFDAIPEAS